MRYDERMRGSALDGYPRRGCVAQGARCISSFWAGTLEKNIPRTLVDVPAFIAALLHYSLFFFDNEVTGAVN